MSESENFSSFFKENKNLAKEYLETKLEVYKLGLIRISSKTAGYLIWAIISFFLLWLFIIFIGLVAGFWLSKITGSYVYGFGIVAVVILIKMLLLTLLRKPLFINPIIRAVIHNANEEKDSHKKD